MRERRDAHVVVLTTILLLILGAGLAAAQMPDPTGASPPAPVEPTPSGEGDLLVDLWLKSPNQLQELMEAGADIWEVEGLRVRARLPRKSASLVTAKVAAVDQVRVLAPQPNLSTQVLFGPGGYRRYVDVVARLNELAGLRPDLVTVLDVGDSWEKTQGGTDRDLWAVRITAAGRGPAVKPQVLFVGEHHAREIVSSEIALMLVEYVVTGYGSDAEVTYLVDNREIWVLPMVNPDGHVKVENGYEYWRKNTDTSAGGDGVDLNRNYGYMWGGIGASGDPLSEVYRGAAPFSEPEARAVRDLFQSHNFRAVLSFHTAGREILWPWGYTPLSTGLDPKLSRLGSKLASYGGYTPMQSVNLYITNGDTCDWVYGTSGVQCFTDEIGSWYDNPGGNPFAQPYSMIPQYWSENKPAALYLANVVGDLEEVWGPETTGLGVSPNPAGPSEAITIQAHLAGLTSGDTSVFQAEYFVDGAGSPGTGQPLSPVDASYDEWSEDVSGSIPASSLSGGKHLVMVRGRNAAGKWGPLSATFVTVTTSPSASPSPTSTPTSTATPVASPTRTSTPTPTNTMTSSPTVSATRTPMVVQTPSATPTAPSSTVRELVVNGGVESGFTGWTTGGTLSPLPVPQHHGGFFGVIVGTSWLAWPQSTDSWLKQKISIPGDATNVVFSFWYWPLSQDVVSKDWQEVVVRDELGRVMETVVKRAGNEQRWQQVQGDLSRYAGQRVELGFHVHADNDTRRTYMLVDDVSVLAIAGGAGTTPTSTPTWTWTPTWTATWTWTPTLTTTASVPLPTESPTLTATRTPTETATSSATPTPPAPTLTSTSTATRVATATPTASPTAGVVGPPAITSAGVTNLTRSSARVVWTTSMPSTSQVEWGRSPYFPLRTPLDVQLVTAHGVDLTGLSPYTAYYYRMRSRAAGGSEVVSQWYFFITRW